MTELFKKAVPVTAVKTNEGFIEITALEELDDIVGGLTMAESDDWTFEIKLEDTKESY